MYSAPLDSLDSDFARFLYGNDSAAIEAFVSKLRKLDFDFPGFRDLMLKLRLKPEYMGQPPSRWLKTISNIHTETNTDTRGRSKDYIRIPMWDSTTYFLGDSDPGEHRRPAPAKRRPAPAKRRPAPAKRRPAPAKRRPAPAKRKSPGKYWTLVYTPSRKSRR
jgi:hypothetical protein